MTATRVAGLGDDPEVVRDEHGRHAGLLAQASQQREDLRLRRHVERRRRLVCEQQTGPSRGRDGEHHALTHAAAQLMRIGANALLRLRDADVAQRLDGSRLGLL